MTVLDQKPQPRQPAAAVDVSPIASAQVENVAKSTTRAAFHPSLGMPEETLAYRVSPLFQQEMRRDGAAAAASSEVLLRVTIPPASVPLIFAHRQWRAGLVLADLIAAEARHEAAAEAAEGAELNLPPRHRPLAVRGETLLELGCGTGIPGMVARKLGAAGQTILTDYDSPTIISTLKENVRGNFSEAEIKSGGIRAMGYTWGTSSEDVQDTLESMVRASSVTTARPSSLPTSSSFGRILIADCMWDALSHAVLIESLTQLLSRSPDARVLVVSGLHTGREKIVSFIRRAARVGLVLQDVDPGGCILPAINTDDDAAETPSSPLPSSDACSEAHRFIYEVELSDGDEETSNNSGNGSVADAGVAVIDTGASPRLTGRRRPFVIDERPEERKEVGGVHVRNRWITIWALGWR